MAAATAIVAADRPGGHHYGGTFVLNPGSIGAAGRELQTVAVPGVAVGDVAFVAPRAALLAGIVIAYVRCSAGEIEFSIENHSAGAVDAASDTWDFQVLRGSSGPLR
jgi:hypothetical protein